ncbi:unnamed protein product, partial [Didymodactylos carnosus]
LQAIKNFDPVNTGLEPCSGRRCARCGQCRDWYYTGDLASLAWLQNWKKWSKSDWERYRHNNISQRFKKRIDATCFYHLCVIDGDDIDLGLHFHAIGANGYYHAHQNLCLCNDNVRK